MNTTSSAERRPEVVMTEQILPDVRRAAAYGRLSEMDDPNDTDSVDGQLERGAAHIERRGWDLVGTFRDDGISAYSGRPRPGYDALLAEVAAGRVDTIVVRHLDRLSRNDVEAAHARRFLREHRVLIAEYGGMEYPTWTAHGQHMMRTMSSNGAFESDVKSERVREAAERRAQEGRMNGPCPYGWRREYERTPSGRVLRSWEVEDPEAAAIVREVTRRLLAGDSLLGITRDLNDRQVPSPGAGFDFRHKGRAIDNPDGSRWSKSSVRKLALRASNAALRIHNGQEIQGQWPALVPVADWRRVVALLEAQRPQTVVDEDGAERVVGPKRPGSRQHLLTWGIGQCGKCGGHLRMAMRGQPGKIKYAYYVCAMCGRVGRRLDHVDTRVADVVIERLSQPDALAWLAPDGRELAEVTQRAADARELLRVAGAKLAAGEWTPDTVDAVTKATRPKLDAAEAEIRRLTVARDHSALLDMVGPEAERRWAEAPLLVRRKVLELLGITVIIKPVGRRGPGFDPSSVEIVWRGQD